MAFGPVLYRLNKYATADYSVNPPLLTASDSITDSDSGIVTTISSPVATSMSAPTDAIIATMTALLADSLMSSDVGVVTLNTTLVDFLLCKEFTGGTLGRAKMWIVGGPSRTVTPHKYGQVLYAKNMYSTNIALLWAQVKKDVESTFTNQNGHKYNS